MAAGRAMLDEQHDLLEQNWDDENTYTTGRIGRHNVVLACLPAGVTGTLSAAGVAYQMRQTFQGIKIRLMVGIGGGAPSENHDIRLGDVVVSKPTNDSGGVIQYDFGKALQEGRFMRTGMLNKPPDVLLSALANLQSKHMMEGDELAKHQSAMLIRYPRMAGQFARPGTQDDLLYDANYDHMTEDATCSNCDTDRLIKREPRNSEDPLVHYGLVASGNQVMRSGAKREQLRKEHDVLCFEMEAAGLMNNLSCLVIRGICDYADSHKNKQWQGYAAATAAAYAKELLSVIPGNLLVNTPTAASQIDDQASDTIQFTSSQDSSNSSTSYMVASASFDSTVRLWDSATGLLCHVLKDQSYYVSGVAFSPDGKLIASADADHKVRLWDSATGVLCRKLKGHSHDVVGVAFSPDGRLVASASCDTKIKLWDSATGALHRTLKGHSKALTSVKFSPDNRLLASTSEDKTVRLWDYATGGLLRTLEGHSNKVLDAAFSPDGKLVASACRDGKVRLWDPATGALHLMLEGYQGRGGLAFSPDGRLLALASLKCSVVLWDLAAGAIHRRLEGHASFIYGISFSPNGRLVASTSYDRTIRLWDSATGTLCRTLIGHSEAVTSVAFSPDSRLVASVY